MIVGKAAQGLSSHSYIRIILIDFLNKSRIFNTPPPGNNNLKPVTKFAKVVMSSEPPNLCQYIS